MPKAQVVADIFHVMVQINKELDTQIKQEKRNVEQLIKKAKTSSKKVEYENTLAVINKSKYVLLKNESDLNEEEKTKLIQAK